MSKEAKRAAEKIQLFWSQVQNSKIPNARMSTDDIIYIIDTEFEKVIENRNNIIKLLKKVLPENMGGYPDLFYPDGYERNRDPWGDFEEDVKKELEN